MFELVEAEYKQRGMSIGEFPAQTCHTRMHLNQKVALQQTARHLSSLETQLDGPETTVTAISNGP
jgi:hypothetical protein